MTSTPTRPVDNVVIATKGLQDRNINILAGMTVENKGKLIHFTMQNLHLREHSAEAFRCHVHHYQRLAIWVQF